jgi:hypothetical protein
VPLKFCGKMGGFITITPRASILSPRLFWPLKAKRRKRERGWLIPKPAIDQAGQKPSFVIYPCEIAINVDEKRLLLLHKRRVDMKDP